MAMIGSSEGRVPPSASGADRAGEEGPSTPPMSLLWWATGSVVLSVLFLLLTGKAINLAGYLLATLVASILVGQFRAIDGRRRSRPTYTVPRSAQVVAPVKLAMTLLLVGYLIGAIHVWILADAVARS
jgi:hypothetical protein